MRDIGVKLPNIENLSHVPPQIRFIEKLFANKEKVEEIMSLYASRKKLKLHLNLFQILKMSVCSPFLALLAI